MIKTESMNGGGITRGKSRGKNTREYSSGRIAASMAAMYGLNGGSQFISVGVIAIFLGSHEFINNTQVGFLVAFASLVTAAAQPLWGFIADHAATKNRVLAIVHVGIACMVWLFILPRHTSFLTLIPAVFAIYSLAYIPMSLTDTIVVENLQKVRLRYGVIRSFGSGGAALAAFTLFIIESFMDIRPQYSFIILFCTTSLALIPLRYIPRTVGHAHRAGSAKVGTGNRRAGRSAGNTTAPPDAASIATTLADSASIAAATQYTADNATAPPDAAANDETGDSKAAGRAGFNFTEIAHNKRLVLLLAYGFFTFVCIGCQNSYFSVYYATERGLNAGVGKYGLLFTVCIAAEAAVMSLGYRVYNRLNIYTVFTMIQIFACIRGLIMFFSPDENIMFIMAIVHGHVFGLLFLRVAPYIGSIVPDEMRATSQACWSVMFMGLGPVMGSILGGLITLRFDLQYVFLHSAFALSAITAIFFVLFHRQRKIDKIEGYNTA